MERESAIIHFDRHFYSLKSDWLSAKMTDNGVIYSNWRVHARTFPRNVRREEILQLFLRKLPPKKYGNFSWFWHVENCLENRRLIMGPRGYSLLLFCKISHKNPVFFGSFSIAKSIAPLITGDDSIPKIHSTIQWSALVFHQICEIIIFISWSS